MFQRGLRRRPLKTVGGTIYSSVGTGSFRRRFRTGVQRLRQQNLWQARVGPMAMAANAQASRALTLIRKFKKEEELKLLTNSTPTMQIPIEGNWIVEGFGPYCAQGNTRTTRIGNKTTVESLFMRFLIKLTALEATGCAVRLICVMDRRPTGANATVPLMMAVNNQINSPYTKDEEYKGRFQYLMDKTYVFDSAQTMKQGKLFFKKPIKILYNANNGTVADLQKGNFLFLAMAEGNAAAIDVDYSFTFRFTDT